MKKVLVTGSCGFILGQFIRKAIHNKTDYTFASIDKGVEAKTLNKIYYNSRHQFYLADITDEEIIDRIFQKEKPDIVIHGAAETFVDDAIKASTPFAKTNVVGTQILVNAALKYKVDKFIYLSTDEVYGHLADESSASWTESSPLAPRNPYSASKAAGELIVQAASSTYGLNYNITRSCNNFGSWQLSRNFIPKAISKILANEKMPIYGQGKQMREWLYVEDNCAALMTILEKGFTNQIYNISAGYETSNIELFQDICNVFQKGYDLIQFVEDRAGHDYRYSVDATKLKSLGWAPAFKFKPALTETCQWYANNTWFLR